MAVQRLTAAYRSRPRPSSTPGAKASTVNSYYLDGERLTPTRGVNRFKSITHTTPETIWLREWCYLALCSFQGPPRRTPGFSGGGLSKLSSVAVYRSRPTSPVDVLEKSP
jgi:hypothetical protein